MNELSSQDERLLRRAIELSRRAAENGDLPFGALLADAEGNVLFEAKNTTNSGNNPLLHAETNLLHLALAESSVEDLASATLFTSCQPCAMCAGAMYWAGINRVVYGMDERQLLAYVIDLPAESDMSSVAPEDILNCGGRTVEVIGPKLVDEACAVYEELALGPD